MPSGTTNPGTAYHQLSQQYTTFDWGPEANISGRRAIGNVDPEQFDRGPEAHDLTISFFLQGSIQATTPVYDAMMRDSDNLIPHSYTWVDREKFHSGGTAGEGYRTYTVAEGWKPGDLSLPGDPGSGEPINAEISGNAEKIRSYKLDQPATTSASIAAHGAKATVIVQDDQYATLKLSVPDGAGTVGGTITSGATNPVDAVFLPNPASSSVHIVEQEGSAGPTYGATLITIKGKDSYDNLEGDRGIPFVTASTGTHEADPKGGLTYQSLIGDTIQWGGTDLAFGINSVEFSISNNLEQVARQGYKRQRIFAGNRDTELTTTVYGNAESHDKIMAYLQKDTGTIAWTMDCDTLVVDGAVLSDAGNRTVEQGQAFMELDNTFTGTGVTINHSP